MKQWVQKLMHQFDINDSRRLPQDHGDAFEISEDRATLLYIIDTYNKHLIETENYPSRKVREIFDDFTKELVKPQSEKHEKVLFRLRQYFNTHRIDEYAYIQKTFDDFKSIIFDFVDQLAEDFRQEEMSDREVNQSLSGLKEAVEANSIDELREKSRDFIDRYMEYQSRQDERKTRRMSAVKKNLDAVKKQLTEANRSMRVDHLTNAYNRKSFDEKAKQHWHLFELTQVPVSLITLDIDHFKKINDAYGHDIGDFVLKECVRILKEVFHRDSDFVARVGGEEFAILLPDYQVEHAVKKAEAALEKIRKDTLVHANLQIQFTASMGIAQLQPGESVHDWIKRGDQALYESKRTGRDRFTIASKHLAPHKVA